jgi:hypothetical protein
VKNCFARYFSPTGNDEVTPNLDSVVKHKIGRPIALPSGIETQSAKYVSSNQETGFVLSVSSICYVPFRLVEKSGRRRPFNNKQERQCTRKQNMAAHSRNHFCRPKQEVLGLHILRGCL